MRATLVPVDQPKSARLVPVEDKSSALPPMAPAVKTLESIGRVYPVAETAASMATGFAAMAPAGLAGLGQLAANKVAEIVESKSGQKMPEWMHGDVNKIMQDTAGALTYQPKTEYGQHLTDAAMYPIDMWMKGGEKVGDYVLEKTGNPELAATVATAIQAGPMAVGPAKRAVSAKRTNTAKLVPVEAETAIPEKLAKVFPDAEESLRHAKNVSAETEGQIAAIVKDKVGQKADAAVALANRKPELAAKTAQEAIENGRKLEVADGPLTESLVEAELAKVKAIAEPPVDLAAELKRVKSEAEMPELPGNIGEKVSAEGMPTYVRRAEPLSAGASVKVGKSPQTHTIVEELPTTEAERAMGERYFTVKNDKTGKVDTVEAGDLKPIKRAAMPAEGSVAAGGLAYGMELPKYAINVNLERVGADYSTKKLILDISDMYAEKIKEAKQGKITLEETRQRANEVIDMIGETGGVDKFLASVGKKTQDLDAYVTASRDILNTSAQRLNELRQAAVEIGSDEALANFKLAMERHANIQAEVGGVSSKIGRALSAHRLMSEPTKNWKAILHSLGGREITEEIAFRLSQIDPTDTIAVNKLIRQVSKAKTTDMIYEAWMNAILSAPTTHAVNVTSNSLVFLTKLIEEPTAAGYDFMRSLVTRTPRERYFLETPAHIFGTWQGVKEGTRKAITAFQTEMPSQGISKLETGRYQAIPSKTIKVGGGEIEVGGKQVRIPGRALMAEDEFFKAINYQAEIHSMAYRQAVKEKLTGTKRAERIAEILADPPAEMRAVADKEMLYRVFQSELGAPGRSLMQLRDVTPGLKYIIPFLRTPVNIAKFGLERTPLYYPVILRNVLKGELKAGALSDEMAKATMGTIIGLSVAMYAKEGNITGGGPKDAAEKEALYRTGWQPYSLKIGDKYYAYGRLEPLGMVMGLAADYAEISESLSEGEREEMAAQVSLAIARNITSKTFMQGLSNAINAVSDPVRYGDSWVHRFASSVVPRVVAAGARADDPTMRREESIGEAVMAAVPGEREKLLPKRNLWGEPISIQGSPAEIMFSPIRTSAVTKDKVNDEMVRLKVFISPPLDTVHGIKLTPEEHDKLILDSGQWAKKKLDQKVNASGYRLMNDIGKEKMLRDIIFAGRERARELMYRRIMATDPIRAKAHLKGGK